MSPSVKPPCRDCPDRILPTKDNPQTCHGNCKKEAAFLEAVKKEREAKEKQRFENNDYLRARSTHLRRK